MSSYDGIVGRITEPLAAEARRTGTPIVNVWLSSPAKGLPGVFPDVEAAGAMAANHLLGRGFRNFGTLYLANSLASQLQLKGFRTAIKAAGFSCSVFRDSYDCSGDNGWDILLDKQEAWLDTLKMPVGIHGVSDVISRYMIDLCHSKELNVPGDIAVVGNGDEEAICLSQRPTITSIELGFEQVGYQAAKLLDRLMDGGQPPEQPLLIKPQALIPRQSTDSYAVEDPVVAQAMRFMTDRCQYPIKVTDVVAAVPASHRSLGRRFQTTMGRSISDELLRQRVERAKRILVESDEAVKVVARASGFSNYSHFYKAFVRLTDTTPKEYRQQNR
ncbi:MAG: substrate-binding domain-containing protein [bacterium]|nr:substrate-binding domain-containing protein [bacterium]